MNRLWIILVVMAVTAQAGTKNWKTATTGNWSTVASWVENALPIAGDDVIITNAGAAAILSTSTPLLNSVLVKGSITFTNWDSTLKAVTVTVLSGGQITHYINTATNAPWTPTSRVVIECTNLAVEVNGAINADSKGYTGDKNRGGYGPGGQSVAWAYGGGYGGAGGLSSVGSAFTSGQVYGDPFTPTNPGSAGAGHTSYAGGNGGGAIFVTATGEARVDGTVSANGGNYTPTYGSGGSGGSVLLVCGTFTGSGSVGARGGTASSAGGTGGGGRISIRYGAAQGNLVSQPLALLDASAPQSSAYNGDLGTIWLPDTLLMRESLGNLNGQIFGFGAWSPSRIACTNSRVRFVQDGFQLRVTNSILISGATGSVEVGSARFMYNRLYSTVSNTPVIVEAGGDLILTNSGAFRLFSMATNASPDYGALLSVTGQVAVYSNAALSLYSEITNGGSALVRAGAVRVDAFGRIEADGKGYGNLGPYVGSPIVSVGPGGGLRNSGGSHGGGGNLSSYAASQTLLAGDIQTNTYGSVTNPLTAGSTGGRNPASTGVIGNDGGGVVRIETTGRVYVAGTISANGAANGSGTYEGGGAGGSVNIRCRILEGSIGVVRANGGEGGVNSPANGGGGRIAVWYDPVAQAQLPAPDVSFSAVGGVLGSGNAGDVGSLFFPDNRFLTTPLRHSGEWRVAGVTSWAVDSLLVSNQWFRFPAPGFALTVTNTLTVIGTNSLWHRLELSNGGVACGRLEARNGRLNLMRTDNGGSRLSCTGDMVVDSGWVNVISGSTNVMLESTGLTLTNSGWLQVEAAATNPAVADQGGLVRVIGSTVIGPGCWVRPLAHGVTGGSVKMIFDTLTVAAGGGFDASAAGFREMGNFSTNFGTGPGRGRDYGGAGYGGAGGLPGSVTAVNTNGLPYGLANAPIGAGSAGGKHSTNWRPYNWGGGVVRIRADRMTLAGTINADGGGTQVASGGGGGAGGGILVWSKTFSGASGTISARGGHADSNASGAGGGGGRIALWVGAFTDQDEQALLAGQGVSRMTSSTTWSGLLGTVILAGGTNGTVTPRQGDSGTFVALVKSASSGTLILVK